MLEANDRPREQMRLQRIDGRCQQRADAKDEIPQRLRRDVEATLGSHRNLAYERDLVCILVDGSFDRDGQAVARARRGALRPEGGFDAAATAAHIFLALDLHDAVLHVDDINHF